MTALFAVALPAMAAETSNSEFVIIRTDDVLKDDLYAGAIRVVVDGTIDGDLFAFAAEEVVINGTVTGSVTAASPRVIVNGKVGGSLRVTGNSLTVVGDVAGDVVAAVWSAQLGPESTVGGEVVAWAWQLAALGEIGEDLTGSQRNLDLAGSIGSDVEVSAHRLSIVQPLSVGGDLDYRSSKKAQGIDQADVAGVVVKETPLPPNLRVRALSVLGRFMIVLFLAIASLTVGYGWPDRTSQAVALVTRSPLRKWLSGALLLFSPLLATLVTGVILGLAPAAAAFPLLLVLVPIILALTGIAFALALIAGAPTAGWIGGTLFKRFDLYGSIVTGSVVVGVVWYLPIVGWIVPLVVLPLGLGAWIEALRQVSSSPTAEPQGRESIASSAS